MRTQYSSQKNKNHGHLQLTKLSFNWNLYWFSLVQYDINDAKILNTKRPKDNLTKGVQKALEELSNRDDIIITNADKGGAIVIMDIDKYTFEAQRQLNDQSNCKKLQIDPTLQQNKISKWHSRKILKR